MYYHSNNNTFRTFKPYSIPPNQIYISSTINKGEKDAEFCS